MNCHRNIIATKDPFLTFKINESSIQQQQLNKQTIQTSAEVQEPIKLKQISDSRDLGADGFQVGDGGLARIGGRAPIQCGGDGMSNGGGSAAAVIHGASRAINESEAEGLAVD